MKSGIKIKPFISLFPIVLLFHSLNAVLTAQIPSLDSREIKAVITEALSTFPQDDLEQNVYPEFSQQANTEGTTYISQSNPQKTFARPNKQEAGKPFVFMQEESNANLGFQDLENLNPDNYIVLIQSPRKGEIYTAHRAYIRTINGKLGVEWDLYDIFGPHEEFSVMAAFTPAEYRWDSPSQIAQGVPSYNDPSKDLSIGTRTKSGFPKFYSRNISFVGLLGCKFNDELSPQAPDASNMEQLVDFFLHTLRAECYKEIQESTRKLFEEGIVSVNKEDGNPDSGITLNLESELLKREVLNPHQRSQFLSAIFLSEYSEAFTEHLGLKPQPDINPTVSTLATAVVKILKLLTLDQFDRHSVKIRLSLFSTIRERIGRTKTEGEFMKLFCSKNKQNRDCRRERKINSASFKYLKSML